MVQSILDYGGQKVRSSDLFKNDTPIALTKKFFKGLNVSVIFTLALILCKHIVVYLDCIGSIEIGD